MITFLMLRGNLTHPVMGELDSATKIFFDLFAKLLHRHGVPQENAWFYSHAFVASITGILMTFRNFQLKDKAATRNHIIKVVEITASLYSNQLLGHQEARGACHPFLRPKGGKYGKDRIGTSGPGNRGNGSHHHH